MSSRMRPAPSLHLALALASGGMWDEARETLLEMPPEEVEKAREKTLLTLAPVAWISPPAKSFADGFLNDHGQVRVPAFASVAWRACACFFNHGRRSGTHMEVADQDLLEGRVGAFVRAVPRPQALDRDDPLFDQSLLDKVSACARNTLSPNNPMEEAAALMLVESGAVAPESTCILHSAMFSQDAFLRPLEAICREDALLDGFSVADALSQVCSSSVLGARDRVSVVEKLLSLGADPVLAAILFKGRLESNIRASGNPCGEIHMPTATNDPALAILLRAARVESERRQLEKSSPSSPASPTPSV